MELPQKLRLPEPGGLYFDKSVREKEFKQIQLKSSKLQRGLRNARRLAVDREAAAQKAMCETEAHVRFKLSTFQLMMKANLIKTI